VPVGAASTISWFSECRIWSRTDVQQTRVITLVMNTVLPESAVDSGCLVISYLESVPMAHYVDKAIVPGYRGPG